MTQPRHRAARSRRSIAVPVAVSAAVVSILAAGTLVTTLVGSEDGAPAAEADATGSVDADRSTSDQTVSRSLVGGRTALLNGLVDQGKAIEEKPGSTSGSLTDVAAVVVGKRYLTADLNVWSGPGERYRLATVLPTGDRVKITGLVDGAWAQIVHEHKARWVRAAYLSRQKPVEEEPADASSDGSGSDTAATAGGVTEQPCPLGTSVEAGLTPDAIRVYRSVCARFPEVTTYGGVRPDDGEHGTGQALDIMVSSSSLGDAIAEWVRANASALGASEVLWAQHIWTVERSSEGWRLFEDRGSATANHYDHVHVTVYGNSGG